MSLSTSRSGTIKEAELHLYAQLKMESGSMTGTITVPDTSPHEEYEHWGDGDPEAYVFQSIADRDQVIPTRNKVMDDDLTIKKVEYQETVNAAGGKTIYIANNK